MSCDTYGTEERLMTRVNPHHDHHDPFLDMASCALQEKIGPFPPTNLDGFRISNSVPIYKFEEYGEGEGGEWGQGRDQEDEFQDVLKLTFDPNADHPGGQGHGGSIDRGRVSGLIDHTLEGISMVMELLDETADKVVALCEIRKSWARIHSKCLKYTKGTEECPPEDGVIDLDFPPPPVTSWTPPPPLTPFTPRQIAYLLDRFLQVATGNLIPIQKFHFVLHDTIIVSKDAEFPFAQYLPTQWLTLTSGQLYQFCSKLLVQHGFVNWRDFILGLMDLTPPTQAQLRSILKTFKTLDPLNHCCVDKNKFDLVHFWFEPTDLDGLQEHWRTTILWREILFGLFKDRCNMFFYIDFLLYFCKDPDPRLGLAKALSVLLDHEISTPELLDLPLRDKMMLALDLDLDPGPKMTDSSMDILFAEHKLSAAAADAAGLPLDLIPPPSFRPPRLGNLTTRMAAIRSRVHESRRAHGYLEPSDVIKLTEYNELFKAKMGEEHEGSDEDAHVYGHGHGGKGKVKKSKSKSKVEGYLRSIHSRSKVKVGGRGSNSKSKSKIRSKSRLKSKSSSIVNVGSKAKSLSKSKSKVDLLEGDRLVHTPDSANTDDTGSLKTNVDHHHDHDHGSGGSKTKVKKKDLHEKSSSTVSGGKKKKARKGSYKHKSETDQGHHVGHGDYDDEGPAHHKGHDDEAEGHHKGQHGKDKDTDEGHHKGKHKDEDHHNKGKQKQGHDEDEDHHKGKHKEGHHDEDKGQHKRKGSHGEKEGHHEKGKHKDDEDGSKHDEGDGHHKGQHKGKHEEHQKTHKDDHDHKGHDGHKGKEKVNNESSNLKTIEENDDGHHPRPKKSKTGGKKDKEKSQGHSTTKLKKHPSRTKTNSSSKGKGRNKGQFGKSSPGSSKSTPRPPLPPTPKSQGSEHGRDSRGFRYSRSYRVRPLPKGPLRQIPVAAFTQAIWFGHITAYPTQDPSLTSEDYLKIKDMILEVYEEIHFQGGEGNYDPRNMADLATVLRHPFVTEILKRYTVYQVTQLSEWFFEASNLVESESDESDTEPVDPLLDPSWDSS